MDTIPAPAMTESSFASLRCYLPERSVSRYVGRHYPALFAPRTHAPDLHALDLTRFGGQFVVSLSVSFPSSNV
jgi:hypothetical protein